jgi:carboxyl-terminal processing protease
MEGSKKIYKGLLETPNDFTIDESFDTDYDKMPYAKNNKELIDRWRKQMKLSALSSITKEESLELLQQ